LVSLRNKSVKKKEYAKMCRMLKLGAKALACVVAVVVLTPSWMGQTPAPQLCVSRIVSIEYPHFAKMAAMQGTVEVAATVSPAGTVTATRRVSGKEILAAAAAHNLSQWRFRGCDQQSGCEIKVIFSFVLSGSCYVGTDCPTEFEADLPGKVQVTSKSFVSDRPIP
jgi:hypothetical protein